MLTEIIASVLLGLPTLALVILSQVELWQRKEYRWDRMQSYLVGPAGYQYLRSWLLPAVLLTDAGWLAYLQQQELWAAYFGMAALLCFAAYHVARARRQGIFRPVLTHKAWLILAVTAFVVLYVARLMVIAGQELALQLATLIMLLPLLAAAVVGLVNMVTAARKRQIIARAARARRQMRDLTVIGITGSYGKTSTKYFLQQLLPEAVVTPEHVNSEIAVAGDLLRRGKLAGTYVVEMGAYRRGEIAALARMTKPRVGVITAIGNQHLDLFGSQENILLAKWELIEGLAGDGIAVLNADDPWLVKKAKEHPGKIIWYGGQGDAQAIDILVQPRQLTCNLHIGLASQTVTIPLASRGLLGSVLAAVAAAYAAGATAEGIFERVQKLEPFARTMELRTGRGGATIIDDSYSANEQGVLNAVEHLKIFSEPDKRIIMVPLIELGPEASVVHQRIGQALKESGAKVFVYGRAHQKELGQPVFTDAKKLAEHARVGLTEKSVVLLEGRIPDTVRQAVL